ncbi:MAG TPA: hypothetical protein VGM94_12220 [Galbitalea sp.]
MTPDDDDDALSWGGARDPSHFETPVAAIAPKPTRAERRAARSQDVAPWHEPAPGEEDETDAATAGRFGAVADGAVLISLGILGGIYLLYTVGWIISLQRLYYIATTALDQEAFVVQQYLAIAAPVAWFVAVIWFTRHRHPVARLIWLIVGAVVLVPWPFVLGS